MLTVPETRLALRAVFTRNSFRGGLRFWLPAAAVLVAGAALRLVWVEDMEYKADELGYFTVVKSVRGGAPWPRFGFPSSQNTPAHGMSVWVFLLLDRVVPSETPIELARLCQWLNILAFAGFLAFARLCVAPPWRSVWVWGLALAAVNPIAVLLQRKIWPVSITPVFLLAVLVGFWHRDRRWGAALWGAAAMLTGQVHAAGLILAAGLAGWALAFDRRRVRWLWWVLGSAATGWLLIPWLLATHDAPPGAETGQFRLSNIATLSFYLRWTTEPLGVILSYSLGRDFPDFLRYPLVSGRPTYLVGVLHAAMFALAGYFWITTLVSGWRKRSQWRALLAGSSSPTAFVTAAVALGYGGLLTLSCVPVHRHYMLLAFPMTFVALAAVALADRRPFRFGLSRGQALLLVLWLVQSAVSACFLGYVHDAHRTIRGDYGTPYSAQLRYGLPPK